LSRLQLKLQKTMKLTDVQVRILGSLIEKEITTPENYPLSLNALRNACNQSSSREPVMSLDEDEARQGLHVLEDMGLADSSQDGRVPKYEHRIRDRLQLRRDETAVICLLLLRGPQTPGELRTRSERMFRFDDPAQVVATLQRLASRTEEEHPEGALVVQLSRQPGSREARWAHLLGGPVDVGAVAAREEPRGRSGLAEEVEELRREVRELKERLDRLEGIG
jgi:uncharacterized protein YceH (UPF0502 family)